MPRQRLQERKNKVRKSLYVCARRGQKGTARPRTYRKSGACSRGFTRDDKGTARVKERSGPAGVRTRSDEEMQFDRIVCNGKGGCWS